MITFAVVEEFKRTETKVFYFTVVRIIDSMHSIRQPSFDDSGAT